MTAAAILADMDNLLSVRERWTQGALARDAQGQVVVPMSDDAVSYCFIGAFEKCAAKTPASEWAQARSYLRRAGQVWRGGRVRTEIEVNDLLGYAVVRTIIATARAYADEWVAG